MFGGILQEIKDEMHQISDAQSEIAEVHRAVQTARDYVHRKRFVLLLIGMYFVVSAVFLPIAVALAVDSRRPMIGSVAVLVGMAFGLGVQ